MGSWDVGIGKDLKDHRTMESLVWVELGWVGGTVRVVEPWNNWVRLSRMGWKGP